MPVGRYRLKTIVVMRQMAVEKNGGKILAGSRIGLNSSSSPEALFHIKFRRTWKTHAAGHAAGILSYWRESKDSFRESFHFSGASCSRSIAGREMYLPLGAILSDELLSLTICKSTTILQFIWCALFCLYRSAYFTTLLLVAFSKINSRKQLNYMILHMVNFNSAKH